MDQLTQLSKLPPWAWGVAIAGGLAFWWFTRNQSSSGSGASTTQGSVNNSTTQCPAYPVPTCATGQSISYVPDALGCPQPVCAASGSNPPGGPTPTSTCNGWQANCTPLLRTYTIDSAFAQANGNYQNLREVFNRYHPSAICCALTWNGSARNRGLDGALWPGFVVYY